MKLKRVIILMLRYGEQESLSGNFFIDDMADACVYLMETYDGEEHVNIGTGKEFIIRELAEMIEEVVGYKSELKFNPDKPDGTLRKLIDVSILEGLSWKYKIELKDGIKESYEWYKANYR